MFNKCLICEYLVSSHKLCLIVSRFTDRLKHKKINNCTGFYKHLLISGAKILALCKNKNMLWFLRIKEQCRGTKLHLWLRSFMTWHLLALKDKLNSHRCFATLKSQSFKNSLNNMPSSWLFDHRNRRKKSPPYYLPIIIRCVMCFFSGNKGFV